MKRRKIIAANWKMYKDLAEANDFITFLLEKLPDTNAEIAIAPSYIALWHAFEATRNYPVEIIAQNLHYAEQGAFTGEVSATQLKSVGIQRVILGHSERREYFGESDALLKKKVQTALKNDLNIIFCVGEQLKDRKAGTQVEVVKSQLQNTLFHLNKNDWQHLVIAYEPVWAIGTGETASPQQAQEMHQHIRETITGTYGSDTAEKLSVIYGGSVKPENASALFVQPDIDGALVGGASLEVDSFVEIIKSI
ncbi:triose-phosphate isomerase [uncultured Planktosalinus sp.]|uniref:triose-phosphate isomerase n=1 Tax=uncultured Planktosalinus sp. TaxID=1810935 RepID=UPI0030DAE46F